MGKYIKYFILLLLFLIEIPTYSLEEKNTTEPIVLNVPENKLSLDYLSDVYYGKIENSDDVLPVLKLFSQKGIEFKNSPINSVKATFLYEGQLTMNTHPYSGFSAKHKFATLEPMITINFNNNRTQAMFDINVIRDVPLCTNDFTEKISRAYISHNITKNQTILFGQGARLPINFDGSRSTMQMETVLKSQIGRTFGETRSVGIRNIAEYKYLDYDIGFYDSTRYMREFGKGTGFTGYLMLKPLADVHEKTGDLRFGVGYDIGEYGFSYNQYSLFSAYDYKKFHIKLEYADADGYNGVTYSQNKAEGCYVLLSYDITPKFALLARYDYFIPDKSVNLYSAEYMTGITYKPYKNLKFMLNFIRKSNERMPDSNMILFATRFII